MDHPCKNCNVKFSADKLLVFGDGTFLCETCCPLVTKDPIFLNVQLYWYEAIGLEKILNGEMDLDLMEIRDNIKRDLGETILKLLKTVVPEEGKNNES